MTPEIVKYAWVFPNTVFHSMLKQARNSEYLPLDIYMKLFTGPSNVLQG